MEGQEQARRLMHLDRLVRLHVSRDCTIHQAADRITVYRPCGAGTQVIARGTYDEVVDIITRGPAVAP